MPADPRRKISLVVDFARVAAAQAVLGTDSMTDTVDAALDEVIRLRERRALADLVFTPGRLDLDDPEVRAGAWR